MSLKDKAVAVVQALAVFGGIMGGLAAFMYLNALHYSGVL